MIPKDARPHEVAILEKLLAGNKPLAVALLLHYEDTTTVYRVRAKYKYVFVNEPVCS